MIVHTRGLIIKRYKYGENSIIVHVYTEQSGLQKFFINSVNKKKSFKQVFFQPLSRLELVYNHKNTNNLQHLKEVQHAYVLQEISFNILKSSMALFTQAEQEMVNAIIILENI